MLTLFSNFFGPWVSVDVDGLTPSSVHPFLYGVFFVLAIFREHFLSALFARVFVA